MEHVDQNLNVKQNLLEGWMKRLAQKRDSIHVSDLTNCRRKVCFERLDDNPNPPIPDEKKIKYFHGGEEKHHHLQELLGDEFECEKEIIWTAGGVDIAIR